MFYHFYISLVNNCSLYGCETGVSTTAETAIISFVLAIKTPAGFVNVGNLPASGGIHGFSGRANSNSPFTCAGHKVYAGGNQSKELIVDGKSYGWAGHYYEKVK